MTLELIKNQRGGFFNGTKPGPRISVCSSGSLALNSTATRKYIDNGTKYKFAQVFWDKDENQIVLRLWQNRVDQAYALTIGKNDRTAISVRRLIRDKGLLEKCKKIGKSSFKIYQDPDNKDVISCYVRQAEL